MTTRSTIIPAPNPAPARAHVELADRVHASAIRLLRSLRRTDDADGLTAPRASALSVLVFGGPMTLGELASAEQVTPPTMTRLVQEMAREQLVRVRGDRQDGRVKHVAPTAKGRRLLLAGRDRRVHRLAELLSGCTERERRTLDEASDLLRALAPRL